MMAQKGHAPGSRGRAICARPPFPRCDWYALAENALAENALAENALAAGRSFLDSLEPAQSQALVWAVTKLFVVARGPAKEERLFRLG